MSTVVLSTAFALLPLLAAGLLVAMVLLERQAEQLAPAPALAGRAGRRQRRAQARARKPGQDRNPSPSQSRRRA